jgi:hypothetical protein
MVMTTTTCRDRCRVARICDRHQCNRPDPRVRDQRFEKFEPELKQDCRGFMEQDDDSATY